MRLYTFVNHYLSPIQHGIQTAHVVSELFNRYMNRTFYGTPLCDTLMEWSLNHKTIIVLNGGFSSNLQNIYQVLSENHPYPVATFNEGQDELNGALTAVGIVLPEKVYSMVNAEFSINTKSYSDFSESIKRLSADDLRILHEIRKYKLS